nr:PREDICTED: insulin-like growth factor-binding protein-like 1 [Struthio camelus australis]
MSLLNVFLDGLEEGTECTLSRFADATELGGVADTPGGCAAIRRDLDGLESWAEGNVLKFNKAPVIVVSPKKIHNVTGAQVYLSCEVKAVPTAVITWRKVSESPKGVKLLEELPGDRVNMAVQVRGGPSKHEGTGWVLINPLMKEDEGVYQCHATNMAGETRADGSITVTEQNKSKKASLLAWDNPA